MQVMPCFVVFPATQGFWRFPPPAWYERAIEYVCWDIRSFGLGGGGNTTSRMFNTVLMALEIVGWDVPKIPARVCCLMFSCR